MEAITYLVDRQRSRSSVVLWCLLAIGVSLVFDWLVQFVYFLYESHQYPHLFSGERTLVHYTSGFIGDVIILPLINMLILYVLLKSKLKIRWAGYLTLITVGLFTDAVLHFLQGLLRLTNWSMPKPFDWGFAGYWHMVSFFFQISFIYLFGYIVVHHIYKRNVSAMKAMCTAVVLIGLYMSLLLYDYLPLATLGGHLLALIRYLVF